MISEDIISIFVGMVGYSKSERQKKTPNSSGIRSLSYGLRELCDRAYGSHDNTLLILSKITDVYKKNKLFVAGLHPFYIKKLQ